MSEVSDNDRTLISLAPPETQESEYNKLMAKAKAFQKIANKYLKAAYAIKKVAWRKKREEAKAKAKAKAQARAAQAQAKAKAKAQAANTAIQKGRGKGKRDTRRSAAALHMVHAIASNVAMECPLGTCPGRNVVARFICNCCGYEVPNSQ